MCDLCNLMRVEHFGSKSVKKIVVMDYCIDVCTGDNLCPPGLRMCTYNKSGR